MGADDENFDATSAAVMRAQRAVRQLDRVHRANATCLDERERTGHRSGWVPESLAQAEAELEDQLYFLSLTVRHVIRVRWVLERRGFERVPPILKEDAWWAMRDMQEHWHEDLLGQHLNARRRWQGTSGNEQDPGHAKEWLEDELLSIDGLNLRQLRHDLIALRDWAVTEHDAAFDAMWLEDDAAADLLDLNADEFEQLKPTLDYAIFPDPVGVRWPRGRVSACDVMLRAQVIRGGREGEGG